jgi:hypothetical protein
MLNAPRILGISMAPQKNRRLLLTVIYAVLLVCAAAIIVPPWAARIPVIYVLLFSITLCVLIQIRVFPKMLKVSEFGNRTVAMIVHGMKPGSPEMEEIDEREMAVRNLAHLQAFRIIHLYSVLIVIVFLLWYELDASTIFRFAAIALLLLQLMTFTLPQAIILWMEPDVPEDARVSP